LDDTGKALLSSAITEATVEQLDVQSAGQQRRRQRGIDGRSEMRLSSGDKLGPREIFAQIGASGMGEVYHARNTKLDSDAAIRLRPAALASRWHMPEENELTRAASAFRRAAS